MKKYLFMLFLVLLSIQMYAQNRVQYTGTVIAGDNNEPLPGASVTVKNTSTGTVTDIDGRFSIKAAKDAVFVISFIGFETQELTLKSGNDIRIVLQPDMKVLDESVVVGYGTVKKSELTTASSGIRSEDMNMTGVTSFEQSLQGKLSGVVVINTEGAPGSAMSMEVRGVASISGSSEPLYVIDGMPIESGSDMSAAQAGRSFTQSFNPLAGLNPNDIESIEVLKDASATAIYGSRGANGVVMITTKTGKEGKARVSANFQMGYSKITKKIEVLSAKEYAEYRNWAQDTERYSPELIAGMSDSPTKWQDLIYRLGRTQEYSASVSGGSKKFNYMVSGNYMDQEGIIINSGFNRASARGNFMFELLPGVKLYSKNSFNRSEYNSVTSSTSAGDTKQQGIIKQALRMDPAIPFDQAYDPDEEGIIDTDGTVRNPYIEATAPTQNTVTNRLISSLVLDAQLFKHLNFKPSFGIDYTVSRADSYFPKETQQGRSTAGNDVGFASIQYVETMKWVNENQLTYSNVFAGKHSFTATGVVSLERVLRYKDRSSARGFVTDDLLNNVLQNGLSETYALNTNKTVSSLMSYTARVNYGYDSRYMFTATVRADGSSKFGVNNKWGVFPSASAAWNIYKESWVREAFKKANINNMRLRASWGVVGNQAIPAYQSQSTMSLGWYPSSGGMDATAVPVRLANPDLKWESTEQLNIGFDFGMFRDRISLTFNWYRKMTKELLQSIKIPVSTGFASQWQNKGVIKNSGVELEVAIRPVVTKDFNWSIMANFSHNENVILDLGNVTEQFTENLGSGGSVNYSPFIQKVGYSLGTLWGYQTNGIYQTPEDYADIEESTIHGLNAGDNDELRYEKMAGEVWIIDQNGDHKINDDDRVKIGDVNPKLTYGITNVFSWKFLELSVLFTGKVGGDIYNHVFSELEQMVGYNNMTREAFYNRWQGPGTSNTYPKLRKITDPRTYYASSSFVEDGSYFRIKNLRLTFNFDKELFKMKKFPSGSIYFNVDNLLTVTDYRGYDPEVSSFGQSAAKRGIDMGAYPQCRTFSFGVNLNF